MADQTLPQLVAEISAAMSRIEKRGTAPALLGGFSFVREADVVEALKPELDARGIVLRPDVELLRLDTFTRQGKDMPNTVATISLALYAVRGVEEYLLSRTIGQGADTQDKAIGKATTAAKKQGILIAFAIPTGDDPDAHAIPERRAEKPPARAVAKRTGYRRDELAELAATHRLDLAALERYADRAGIERGTEATNEQIDALIGLIVEDQVLPEMPL